jgi:hypothetical protein
MNKQTIGLSGACLAAALAGFFLARSQFATEHPMQGGRPSGDRAEGSPKSADRAADADRSKPRGPKELAALKSRLTDQFGHSASATYDWILRQQTARLLAELSVADLEQFAAELAPGPSEVTFGDDWRLALRDLVHIAWGLKDPKSLLDKNPLHGVFEDWSARDPAAAAAWLRDATFPPEKERVANLMKFRVLDQQAQADFPAACRMLGDAEPAVRQSALEIWAKRYANDPEKRAEILKLVAGWPDPKFAEAIYQSMIGLMARQSFEDIAQFIDTMEVPADVKDRLNDRVTGEWAMKEPKQAFDAWIELGKTEVPKPLLTAMSRWSLNFPGVDESTQWVNGLAPGPVREQFKTRMIANLTNGERFSYAADLSLGLEDQRERIVKAKQVRRQWLERYPEQAKEGFASLSPEDRTALETPLE